MEKMSYEAQPKNLGSILDAECGDYGESLRNVSGKKSIAYVEDNSRLREIVSNFLEMEGYEVIQIPNKEHLILTLNNGLRGDLFLLDGQVPDRYGGGARTNWNEMVEEIRAREGNPRILVYSAQDYSRECELMGVGYAPKGITEPIVLLDRINNILNERK